MNDKYIGKICPYCKTEIKPTDDIVICSSCEMPHHKECWIANEGCTTFGCTGTIEGADKATEEKTEQEVNRPNVTVFCTRCGAPHEADDLFCSQCGSPLKKNQAERDNSINNQASSNSWAGTYGQASGGYSSTQQQSQGTGYRTAQQQSQNSGYSSNYGSNYNQGAYNQYGSNPYAYEPSAPSLEEGFVGSNYYYYSRAFEDIRSKGKETKWNWASFFFSTYWCFYRKMYKLGGILLGVALLSSLLDTVGVIINFGVAIYMGLYGNKQYMTYVDQSIKEMQQLPDHLRQGYMMQKGGTSIAAALGVAVGFAVIGAILLSN